MGIIKDIPTTSKRRISQCLILANKLKSASLEIEKLKDFTKRLENNLNSLNEEKDLYKNVSDKAKQPYSYIIKNLQDLELELFRKNSEIAEKDKSMKSLIRENDLLNEKISAMEIDLKAILSNRQKIDYLEDMILKFVGNNDERGLIDNINIYLNNNLPVAMNSMNMNMKGNCNDFGNNSYNKNYLSTNFNSVGDNRNNPYPISTMNSYNVAGN